MKVVDRFDGLIDGAEEDEGGLKYCNWYRCKNKKSVARYHDGVSEYRCVDCCPDGDRRMGKLGWKVIE